MGMPPSFAPALASSSAALNPSSSALILQARETKLFTSDFEALRRMPPPISLRSTFPSPHLPQGPAQGRNRGSEGFSARLMTMQIAEHLSLSSTLHSHLPFHTPPPLFSTPSLPQEHRRPFTLDLPSRRRYHSARASTAASPIHPPLSAFVWLHARAEALPSCPTLSPPSIELPRIILIPENRRARIEVETESLILP
jgi:hypothetical protein